MRFSEIPFSPPPRMLRRFAGLWLVFFGGLAAWQAFVRGRPGFGVALGVLAVAVGILGWLRPAALRPVFVGWMIAVFPIGWAVSHVLFGILFFGVFTPLGLIFRLRGRDVLSLRKPGPRDTYWRPRPAPATVRQYFRQF